MLPPDLMGGGGMPAGPMPAGPDPAMGGGPPATLDVPKDTSGQGQPHGPARGDHTDSLNEALSLIDEYIQGETDEQDIAMARKIMADIAKLRSSQQELVDKATGAGPGERLVRKSSGGSGGY